MPKPVARLIGDKQLLKKLEKLQKKAARSIERKVNRAGAAIYKKMIKQMVPQDEGHLKKSIDMKIGKGGAVIGPDRNYEADGDIPANYSHLVEEGHMAPDGTVVPGQHPIARGAQAAEGPAAKAMVDKCRSEINKLL